MFVKIVNNLDVKTQSNLQLYNSPSCLARICDVNLSVRFDTVLDSSVLPTFYVIVLSGEKQKHSDVI
jgi:hypothetical protein